MVDGGGVRSGYPHYRVFAAAEENGAASAVPVAKLKPWPRETTLEARVFAVEKIKSILGWGKPRSKRDFQPPVLQCENRIQTTSEPVGS